MVRKDLARRTAEFMRENNMRKPIQIPKQVFHISDDEGNHKDFTVKKTDKSVLFTVGDVEAILTACQYVLLEAMKAGEEVTIKGFGTLSKRYRKPRVVRNVLDGAKIEMDGHYVPWFEPGNDLRRCLQIYEQSLKDQEMNAPLPIFHQDGV